MTSSPLDSQPKRHLMGNCAKCALLDCVATSEAATLSCMELMPAIGQRPFEAGETLPFDGTVPGKTVVLAVGTAMVEWTLHDGRRQVLAFRVRGDVLSRPAARAEVQTVAVTSGILYLINADTFARCRNRRFDAATTTSPPPRRKWPTWRR